MSKVIRLTESDLHNMIKEAINELDWRTYASAAKKDNRGRSNKFSMAAQKAFKNKYNNGLDTDKYGISTNYNTDKVYYNAPTPHYSKSLVSTYDFADDTCWDNDACSFDPDSIPQAKPRQQYKKAIKDIHHFNNSKSHYNNDTHAWENDED